MSIRPPWKAFRARQAALPTHTPADAVIAGVEGAMITSRARRNSAPYDAVRVALAGYAASVSRSRRA
jgi:hypothetical protein